MMCGLVGVIAGCREQCRVRDIDVLTDTFTRLLVLAERRGPHAIGVAWVKQDGAYRVEKRPLPARAFVQTDRYLHWLDGIDHRVTVLMGHTCWPTRGSARDDRNNHPLLVVTPMGDGTPGSGPQGRRRTRASLLTHNGHLREVEPYFQRWHLPRIAEADSELLVQLAHRHLTPSGYAMTPLLQAMGELQGTMSAVLMTPNAPGEVHLLKGNMPLEVRYHPRRDVLAYASEAAILDRALGDDPGWEPVPLPSGTLLTVQTDDLARPRSPWGRCADWPSTTEDP